jgi:hypothetical protein
VTPRSTVAQEPGEDDVKAAFLYRFASFIEWPAGVGEEEAPFMIALIGDDPVGDALLVLEGREIGGRRVEVRRVPDASQVTGAEIVYIGASKREDVDAILGALRRLPVLTVGDNDDFLDRGGMIRFVVRDRRVRFQVNRCAADREGIQISARLLRVAEAVTDTCERRGPQ